MATFDPRQIGPSHEAALAVIDQCVVSLASFALTVALGRVAGPSELAVYSLAVTLLVVVAAVQDSLISVPYTVYGARLKGDDRAEYTGCSLFFCGALALAASAALALGGAVALAGAGPTDLGWPLLDAAAVLPGMVLREFGRRVSRLRSGSGLSASTRARVRGIVVAARTR